MSTAFASTTQTQATTQTLASARYDDSDPYTIAEAWSATPLEQFDRPLPVAFAESPAADDAYQVEPAPEPDPTLARAKLFGALAAGVIGGATVGAVLFGWAEPAQSTVIAPESSVVVSSLPSAATEAPVMATKTAPAPTVSTPPGSAAPAAVPAPKPAPVPPVIVDVDLPQSPPPEDEQKPQDDQQPQDEQKPDDEQKPGDEEKPDEDKPDPLEQLDLDKLQIPALDPPKPKPELNPFNEIKPTS
jgi:hypothetical protein